MRLIDADAFLNQERKRCEGEPIVGTNTLNNKYLKDVIEKEPTIDAEPVRHGRWLISEYEYFDCPICGEYYPNGCDSHEEAERKLKNHDAYAYCPHCGAKMENGGGEKE